MADRSLPPQSQFPAGPPPGWPEPAPSVPPPAAPIGADRSSAMWKAWPIMVAALVFAVFITWGLGLALAHEYRPVQIQRDGPSATVPITLPTTTTTTPGPPNPTLAQVMPTLIAFVEHARGHQFTTVPTAVAMTSQDFDAFAASLLADQASTIAPIAARYVALGAISDQNWQSQLRPLLVTEPDEAVHGSTDRIGVRTSDGTVNPFTRGGIVFDLTRLLDTETFHLPAPTIASITDDAHFGALAVEDGSAASIEEQYLESLTQPEQQEYNQEAEQALANAGQSGLMLKGLPLLATLPLTYGGQAVNGATQGGAAAIDKLFARLPATSAQALQGDLTGPPIPAEQLALPKADGTITQAGTFAASDLLVTSVGSVQTGSSGFDVTREVGTDWAGGTYVMWEQNGESCIRYHVVGHTDTQTEQLLSLIRNGLVPATSASAKLVTDPSASTPSHEVIEVENCG